MSGALPSWAIRGAKVEPALVRHGPERPGRMCECGDHAFAPLTRGYMTMVSPEDIGVFDRKWAVRVHRQHVSVVRIQSRRSQQLHRLITAAPDGKSVDHINGDTLDNRRENLRVCDQAENSWNSRSHRDKKSGLPKGVFQKRRRFTARMMVRGRAIYLGTFETAEQASAAYNAAAAELHGEFARAA